MGAVFRRHRSELPDHPRVAGPGTAPAEGRAVHDEDGRTVMWQMDCGGRRAEELWHRKAERFSSTGLWPVLIQRGQDLLEFSGSGDWEAGASSDPEAVLRELWAEALPLAQEERDVLAPFGTEFPGLGRGSGRRKAEAIRTAIRAMDGFAGVGLVPVTRPADVVASTGWAGAADHDPALLSAVLRSWEERYEAFVIGMSLDQLFLAVRRPPAGHDAALLLAAEQRAFCVDVVDQGFGSIRALAAALDGTAAWTFWWD
jgi:Domain of unknown function (DUF4253)